MIFKYGFSVVGKSHIKKGTCCQDSHYIKELDNGWTIAAVADGVGSAKNSHIGSKIAAQTVVDFCEECMPWDYNLISIKSMMRTAYNYAYKLILREANKSGEPIESYDTTLTMVIYDGQRIIYGHSGDGAIIGLTTFGDYIEITRPQKGVDGVSVLPLRSGYTQWVIDSFEEDLAAVLLVTDGMLETICPYLLRNFDEKTNCAYIALASFFGDPSGLCAKDEAKLKEMILNFLNAEEDYCIEDFYDRLSFVFNYHTPEDADIILEEYRKNNYPITLMQKEQDDKTVVGLLNIELPIDNKTADYYSEPDWNALQEAWNRKAYPHLYVIKDDDNSDEKNEKELIEAEQGIKEQVSTEEKTNEKEDKVGIESCEQSDKKEIVNNSSCDSNDTSQGNSNNVVSNATKMPESIKTEPISIPKQEKSKEILKPSNPPKHNKPKKKGVIGFFEDLFN